MKIELVSSLLLMSLCWLCLSNQIFVISSLCLDDQKSLLLQLKNNLTFIDMADRSSSKLKSWNASHDCCKWMGVTCDKEGHVTGLDLSEESVSSGFDNSSSLFELQHLENLNLAINYFTCPMTSFGLAKKLTHLNLHGNNLSGSILSSHFEGLPNLVDIDLSYNSFTGSIPSSLFTLPSLQKVSLSHNQFSQLDELINVSSSMLETLDLSSNNLSGIFPASIFQLSTLSILQLSSNKFTGSVELNKLFELKNLTMLDLSYNNLSINVNVTNVDSSFPNISNLYLASCNLKTFPSFLRNLPTLTYLDLSDNQIQEIVPSWIWKLENLVYLNISHNLLTDLEGPLQNCTSNLSYLDLHFNKFQGPIPVFPIYGNVIYLDFSSNKFNSFLPQDIGTYLSRISFLSLSNNTLHGNIPDSLCNGSHLRVLDLSINNISGTIPSCLMMMNESLEVLNLKNNNLSGTIPDTISPSCHLLTLNLHENLLDGPIPKSLAYCLKLEVLDLGSNHIIGGFPCFLNKISTLRILVLRNNKFQGTISCSEASMNWKMLQIVDVAFNNFSGKLGGKYFRTWNRQIMHNEQEAEPKYIEKWFDGPIGNVYYQDRVTLVSKGQQMDLAKILTIYTAIDFSSNHFEGPIPDVFMDFKALYVLNLSNNAFSGEILSSIGNLRQLESLDLSQNFLSGEIPVQLASLSFLSYLNLSFNHLVGNIPTGTQLQSFPASSFEGNDGLYGPPLTENQEDKEPGIVSQPECERLACKIDWNFISVELGLVFGYGIVFCPLLIWKQWRVWYWKFINNILSWIFDQMYLEYVTQRGQTCEILRWGH